MRRQGLKRKVKEICNEQRDQKQIGRDRSGQAVIFRVQFIESFQGETVRGAHACATRQRTRAEVPDWSLEMPAQTIGIVLYASATRSRGTNMRAISKTRERACQLAVFSGTL